MGGWSLSLLFDHPRRLTTVHLLEEGRKVGGWVGGGGGGYILVIHSNTDLPYLFCQWVDEKGMLGRAGREVQLNAQHNKEDRPALLLI